MTATRPTIVTPAYAAAITDATTALAARIRAMPATPDRDSDVDQAAKLAEDFITTLMRHGWRPTAAVPLPDWRPPRRKQAPDVARRGAASARELLGRAGQDTAEAAPHRPDTDEPGSRPGPG